MPGGGGGALGDALPFEAGGGGVEDGAPHRRLLHPRGGLAPAAARMHVEE